MDLCFISNLLYILAFSHAHSFDAQLIEAAANGQTERVKVLLEAGAYVDTREQNGRTTPLMYAAVGGRAEDHTHPTTTQLLCDFVVGDGLADHVIEYASHALPP